MTSTSKAPPPRRLRGLLLVVGLTALGVLIAAMAWVGIRAVLAKQQLESLFPLAGDLRTAMAEGRLSAIEPVVDELGAGARRAASLTGDPIWQATEVLPGIGANLRAGRVAAEQLDALANRVVSPLIAASHSLGGSTSAIDLAKIRKIAPTLSAAAAQVRASQAQLHALPAKGVIPQLEKGVAELRAAVDVVAPTVESLAGFSELAPAMLGVDGHRTILMIVQNNAELRTGGGISGELVQLDAEDGHLSFGAAAANSDFPILDKAIVDVPASTTALYGDVVGRFVQNTTMTADFSLTGRLASAWWEKVKGVTPDVVLSIDPGVLQALLSVTGPVQVAGVTLTADDVVQRLLVDTYLDIPDGAPQDAFFAAAAAAVFSRVTGGDVNLLKLFEALQAPVAEGRISLWSSHADEERVLADGALGGPAVRQARAGDDAFAVYLNDATGAKMDGFLQTSISAGAAQCRANGRLDMAVAVTLHSTAPQDAATSLPGRVTGWGLSGTPAGDISTDVAVSAPPGSFFGGVMIDGERALPADETDVGHPVSLVRVQLSPGETKTARFLFFSTRKKAMTPVILVTPTINAPTIGAMKVGCG